MPKVDHSRHATAGVAFVGGGFMSVVHARAARAAGARLVGVASRTADGAERAQRDLGTEVAYPSWRTLLDDDAVDVVHICSPNQSHAEIAAEAIRAGKHVVCEKPLATNVTGAQDLAELATANSSLVTAIPFVYRYHPMVREARARVLGGRAGRLFSVRGAYLQDWLVDEDDDDWRVDPSHGGPSRAFADIGSHLSDVLQFVTADPIARLSASARTVHENRSINKDITSEDVVTLVFETVGRVIGTMHVSQVAMGHKNRLTIEIDGSRESLSFDGESPDTLRIGTREGFLHRARADDLSPAAARYSVVPPGHPQGYQEAFNNFVSDVYASAAGEEREGLPTFVDGLRAASVTETVLKSHAAGTWLDVPESPLRASSALPHPSLNHTHH